MALTLSPQFHHLARFSLTTAHAEQLENFYIQAFGFHRVSDTRLQGGAFRRLMGVQSDARCLTLALGSEIIELVEFDVPGVPYPAHVTVYETAFQHFAIVVTDMTEAWFRLSRIEGWSTITKGLPQRLPVSSGGVIAFKFRDPEGHPLELLCFPAGKTPKKWSTAPIYRTCIGIDHSAISVSNAVVSTAFYEALGLRVTGRSLNTGLEQEALDGISNVRLDVIALSLAMSTPHVELLCYEIEAQTRSAPWQSNDIACTRLIFVGMSDTEHPRRLSDPDGHHLIFLPDANSQRPLL